MQVENTNCAQFRALEQKRKKAEVEIKIKIYFIIKIHIAIKIMRRLAFLHLVCQMCPQIARLSHWSHLFNRQARLRETLA